MIDHIMNPRPEAFLSRNYVCLDFEIDTSHGDYGHPVHKDNQMLLACWSLGTEHPCFEADGKVYTIWGGEYDLQPLIDHLNVAEIVVAHNSKYELGWLLRCGYDIGSRPVFCTKIAEYVLSGNLTYDTSLDACVRRRGGRCKDPVVDKMMKAGVNPVSIPRAWLQGRCIQDVQTTEQLFLDQVTLLSNTNRLGVMYVRCAFTPVLAYMEQQGMTLDRDRVMAEYNKEVKAEKDLALELEELMGALSPTSTKQLAVYLYERLQFDELRDKRGKPIRTAGDKPITNVATIEKLGLKAKTREQKKFIEVYFNWNKSKQRVTKYLDFYVAVCNQMDGKFYASFNQTVTATHRLSSSGMRIAFDHVVDDKGKKKEGTTQFQNQPREYKRMFRSSREGYLFTEEDGSGLEFRVAGLVGNDPMIKADINDPEFDPHRRSAAIINDIDESEVTKYQRTAAKAHTFKPLFGGQSGTEGEKRYYNAFNERYSALVQTQEQWLRDAKYNKKVILPWGLRTYWPYIKSDKTGYIKERTQIFNLPIQSFATADIIPIQATVLWHLIRENGYENQMVLVNTVHDSVLAEIHEDYLDEYKRLTTESWQQVYHFIKAVYGDTVYDMMEGMPLGTEISWGTHWSEGEEVSYNITANTIEES
jgi:DNA polymerase I-like protein with 3'-5' exonuclease and polymerase domains